MHEVARSALRKLTIVICLLLSGCVFVQSSSISGSTGAGSAVNAEFSDYGILHLTAPETLTSEANSALVKQCQSGVLSNVQTELSMRDWFLIVQYYTITAAGTCR
jgi:hypothetical protein